MEYVWCIHNVYTGIGALCVYIVSIYMYIYMLEKTCDICRYVEMLEPYNENQTCKNQCYRSGVEAEYVVQVSNS